jgi:hypothetical protein
MVGVNSQREIEHAVAAAVANGKAAGVASYPAQVTLTIAGLRLDVAFDGEIRLQK